MKVNPIGYAIVTSLLLTLSPLYTVAQIPQLVPIPEGLSEIQRDELKQQRSDLDKLRKTIAGKVATHNQQCSSVPENTPLEKECRQRKGELEKEKASYIERVIKFNQVVANYEQNSKQLIKITPYTVRLGSVRGEFSIENSDGSRLTNVNIRAGQIAQIASGTRVITGPTGHLQFVLPDETTFTIGEDKL